MVDTTYRLVELSGERRAGQTALTSELAKLVPGDLDRTGRLGMERTDWAEHFEKPKIIRTVLIDAESRPGEWALGVGLSPSSYPMRPQRRKIEGLTDDNNIRRV